MKVSVVVVSMVLLCRANAIWIETAESFMFVAPSTPPTCAKTNCLDAGASCNIAAAGDTCLIPLLCLDAKCSEAKHLYDDCNEDAECNTADGVVYNRYCDGDTCQELAVAGGSCNADGNCELHLVCASSRCSKSGVTLGEACNGTSCRVPLVCDVDNRCKQLAAVNESCSTTLPCDIGLDCLEGVCVRQWSVAIGKSCLDRSCAPPLVCSNSNVCVKPISSAIQEAPCTNDDDCEPDSQCMCDWNTGKTRCTVRTAPGASARVLYWEMISCIKKKQYDHRPCYDKILSWLYARWESRAFVPTPELWCAVNAAPQQLITMLVLFIVPIIVIAM